MSKIVLFEGLDNCFKTTNVKALFNFWNKQNKTAHVLHYSGVKSINSEEARKLSKQLYTEMFEAFEYFHSKNINIICDRSHLGENVYSRYRGYNPSYLWKLEDQFMNHKFWNDVYLIFLRDNIDNTLERDDGLSLSTDRNDKIFERQKFEEAVMITEIPNKKIIDVTNKSKEEILNEILIFLKEDDIEQKAMKTLDTIIEKLNCCNDVQSKKYDESVYEIVKLIRG
jgi:thymidylate kinase